MKIIVALLKPFSFVPAFVMMYLIYSFSAQSGEVSGDLSYQISYQLVELRDRIEQTQKSEWELSQEADSIHLYVRKAAHMTEYFLLALSLALPLYVYGLRGILLFLFVGGISIGFAAFDEYHQSFVDGRGPSIADVFIDGCGALFGAILVQAFCWSAAHNPTRRRKSRSRKRR